MFGNRLGWGISTVILVFAAYLAYLLWQAGQPTPPTGWIAATVHTIDSPRGVEVVAPQMNASSDAGLLYRQAIEDYNQNGPAFQQLADAKHLDAAAVAARPGLAALLEASKSSRMNLFRTSPQDLLLPDADPMPMEAIDALAKIAVRTASLCASAGDPHSAGWYYAAVYALGLHLFQERICYAELAKGEELMGIGCVGLQRLADRQNRADISLALKRVDTDRLAQSEADIQPVWDVVGSVDPSTITLHAGDLLAMANDKSVDPVWRVEAVRNLGRLKYNASRRADQLAAKAIVSQIADDSAEDPVVRMAAEVARDLTIEQFRTLR